VIAGASVAGAAQDTVLFVADQGGRFCFTETSGKALCDVGEHPRVTIKTGETVTWNYAGSTNIHNVAAVSPAVDGAPDWFTSSTPGQYFATSFVSTGTQERTFNVPGTYEFVCQAHAPAMAGTIVVEGDEVEGTPTPTPTATATATAIPTSSPTPTASPTATPDDHTSTPAPGHASVKDSVAPRLQSASLKTVAGGTQVRFWLSEPATVAIKLVRKGSKTSVAAKVVQAPAGTRSLVLRGHALKKGTYTATLAPTDAMGNKGTSITKTLKVK
jgi:plastocyanin